MKKLALLLALACLLTACSAVKNCEDQEKINHVVLIWLKDSGNAQHRQQVIEASRSLEKIPGVIHVSTGEAISSDRKIVDDSFDVGVHMLFTDEAAMNSYTAHPDHQAIVKNEVAPLAEKIVVFDF